MIERIFHCRARGSAWSVEVLAGVSTFLALSYIFIVNPSVLGDAGFPRQAVFFATIIASALATLTMGLWTNLPFVLAPGMEINMYVAMYVVAAGRLTWQEALGAVFWSGILFLLFTLSGVREGIIDALPAGLRSDLAAAVGVLLVAVALKIAGVLVYDGPNVRGFGVIDRSVLVLAGSAIVVFAVAALGVRAAVLISIAAGSLIAVLLGVRDGRPVRRGRRRRPLRAAAPQRLDDRAGAVPDRFLWKRGQVRGPLAQYRTTAGGKASAATRGTADRRRGRRGRLDAGHDERTGVRGERRRNRGRRTHRPDRGHRGHGHAAVSRSRTAARLCSDGRHDRCAELRKRDGWELVALTGMGAIAVATSALHFAILFGLSLHLARDIFRGVRLNAYAIGSIALLLFGWAVSG
jgi:hypothetical protein